MNFTHSVKVKNHKKNKCLKCGGTWYQKSPKVKSLYCVHCHSHLWNRKTK